MSSITYYSGSDSILQFRLPPILLIVFFAFSLSNDSHVGSHLTLTRWSVFCFHPRLLRITALLVENHIRNYDAPKVSCQQADRRLDIPVTHHKTSHLWRKKKVMQLKKLGRLPSQISIRFGERSRQRTSMLPLPITI